MMQAVLNLFGKAKVNVNLLLHLLNAKFYGKWPTNYVMMEPGSEKKCLMSIFHVENILNVKYNFSVLYTFQSNPRNSHKLWHTMNANAQFHFEFSIWVLNSENNLLDFYICTFVSQLFPMLIFKS